jgi:NAD-dependent DNA ligase
MANQRYTARNVTITFIIGFFAGATPFVFMKLLPMMLHPEIYTVEPGQLAIILSGVVLTGCVIGVITSLIFAGEFDQKEPKEVFVYALGIPAILISTVSGLMTDFNAAQKISAVQASASAAVLSASPSTQSIPEVNTSPALQPASTGQGHSFLLRSAWADDLPARRLVANSQSQIIVVIGTYATEKEANDAMNRFQQRKFKTEAYVQKKLELRKLDGKPAQFIVIYGSFSDQARAQRTYDLLKINDPDLNVSLMRAVSQ